MNHLTDAEVLAIREKAFEEAKRYCESLEKENERLREALGLYRQALEENGECCGCGAGFKTAAKADELLNG